VSAVDRAALEPTEDEIAKARARIYDPTDPDEDSDSILPAASGQISGLVHKIRDALAEDNRGLVVRLFRELLAVDRALDVLLTEMTTAVAARLTNGGEH
jgi:phosphate uptake regulator